MGDALGKVRDFLAPIFIVAIILFLFANSFEGCGQQADPTLHLNAGDTAKSISKRLDDACDGGGFPFNFVFKSPQGVVMVRWSRRVLVDCDSKKSKVLSP